MYGAEEVSHKLSALFGSLSESTPSLRGLKSTEKYASGVSTDFTPWATPGISCEGRLNRKIRKRVLNCVFHFVCSDGGDAKGHGVYEIKVFHLNNGEPFGRWYQCKIRFQMESLK